MITMRQRARMLLDPSLYGHTQIEPYDVGQCKLTPPRDQYILRMMLKSPCSGGIVIPEQLLWLKDVIVRSSVLQSQLFVQRPYIYVTVRSGIVRSETDDLWHVDGFSMRKPHCPEQNYIWTSIHPTQVLKQQIPVDKRFDPLVHNLHWYFQDRAIQSNAVTLWPEQLYVIDPYVIHRRPTLPQGTQRTFVRISHVPIEIQSDTNTPNPLFVQPAYNLVDFRNRLVRFDTIR